MTYKEVMTMYKTVKFLRFDYETGVYLQVSGNLENRSFNPNLIYSNPMGGAIVILQQYKMQVPYYAEKK